MIDPTFKSELMEALGTAVGAFNSNPDPNAAVVKAARDHSFNLEQTKRLVETFNTARTLYQYERGEKTAQFPLADQATVIYTLFQPTPTATKTAEFHDYSEYDQPERMAKAGHVIHDLGPITAASDSATTGLTVNGQAERAYKVINSKRAAAEQGFDVSRQVLLMADQEFRKIAMYLRQQYHDDAVDRYARLKRAFDEQPAFAPIMQRLDAWMPAGVRADVTPEKLASYGAVVDDRDLGLLIDSVKEAQRLCEEAANLEAVSLELHKEAAEDETQFVGAVTGDAPKAVDDPLASFFPKRAQVQSGPAPVARQPAGQKPEKVEKPEKPEKGPLAKSLDTAASGMTGSWLPQQLATFNKAQTRPMLEENSKMTERLRNVQRQVIMQDLMINDPMIAEADPQTVGNAYTAVMQLAPEVTANKEVMRAILRHAVHSVAISPFDASSWVELEKLIQDVRGKRPVSPSKPEDKKK